MSTDNERDGTSITKTDRVAGYGEAASDVPSNPELAERMIRVEEQIDHVVETVDRIDDRLTEEHSDLEEEVASNTEDTAELKSSHRLLKWGIATGIALMGVVGTFADVAIGVV